MAAGKLDRNLDLIRIVDELWAALDLAQQCPAANVGRPVVRTALLPCIDHPIEIRVVNRMFGPKSRALFLDREIDRVPGIVVAQIKLDAVKSRDREARSERLRKRNE